MALNRTNWRIKRRPLVVFLAQLAFQSNGKQLNRDETSVNNAMHAKPDLRVVLKWKIARSGSVIADVILLGEIYGKTEGNAS